MRKPNLSIKVEEDGKTAYLYSGKKQVATIRSTITSNKPALEIEGENSVMILPGAENFVTLSFLS
jgi:hypothetical protein